MTSVEHSINHLWVRADVQANRITSADWGDHHPGFCYEAGDPHGEQRIPTEVLEAMFLQERFAVAIWQDNEITKIIASHEPARTFSPRRYLQPRGDVDWCDVARYTMRRDNARLTSVEENIDPRHVLYSLAVALRTPIGERLAGLDQTLLSPESPIKRVLIEFSFETEKEPQPLDTSLAALGAVASQDYLHTIYGVPKV